MAPDQEKGQLLVSEKTGEPLQIWQAAFWRKEEPKEILRKFFERIEEDFIKRKAHGMVLPSRLLQIVLCNKGEKKNWMGNGKMDWIILEKKS